MSDFPKEMPQAAAVGAPSAASDAACKRLQAKKWDGLEPMLEAYAAEAITAARKDFRETLDWDERSLDRLERILNRLSPAPAPLAAEQTECLTLLWGSYFGELLRRLYGGAWLMTPYPGSEFSVPTLEIEGARLYPTVKVHRRLAQGAAEELPGFVEMVRARLAAARAAGEADRHT